MMLEAESSYRLDLAKTRLNTLGGEPIIDTVHEVEPSDVAIEAVTLRGMIVNVVNDYCANAEHGATQVRDLLTQIPRDENENQDACLAWETLAHTVEALRKLTIDEEIDLSAADEIKTIKPDDDAIRRSAGYSQSETDVARSSLQDTGQDVTDEDIAGSASEDVEFQGARTLTPQTAFRLNKSTLFEGILDLSATDRLFPLLRPEHSVDPEEKDIITAKEIRKIYYEIRARMGLLQYRDDEQQQQDAKNT